MKQYSFQNENQIFEAQNLIADVLKDVYAHLADDTSKYFFSQRANYWATGDKSYLINMIKGLDQTATWDEYVELIALISDRLIVYGACADYEISHRGKQYYYKIQATSCNLYLS